jgi:ATP-dependent Clp protease ATP-binding subunit ClpX
VNTTNILFICVGAFVGLEEIIKDRMGSKTVGFGTEPKITGEKQIGDIYRMMEPHDLIKYGLIPEFVE